MASASLKINFADATIRTRLTRCIPLLWLNPQQGSRPTGEILSTLSLTKDDLAGAQRRWDSLAPLLAQLFPQEAPNGRISSQLEPLSLPWLGLGAGAKAFLKMDSNLPVCASVKARGGLYEVFCRAEEVALEKGHLLNKEDDYRKLASPEMRHALQDQEVAVGSTGNLGMSVGLAAAGLGMRATIHMSTDAKTWKKNLLRSRGVNVVEHSGQYCLAVEEGRKAAEANPRCHFVDDEQSKTLFLGYSAAARELQEQLHSMNITISVAEPLIVYIPCGVGGAPGGICWGLKHIFGDCVHVFFAEPTHAPCVTAGLASGLHDRISVQDLGLDGVTEADGLAVGRPSGLVCEMVENLVAGTFTVEDHELFRYMASLLDTEGKFVEPSCCAAFLGPTRLRADPKASSLLERGTHVFWATGGALVPQAERDQYYERGKALLTSKL